MDKLLLHASRSTLKNCHIKSRTPHEKENLGRIVLFLTTALVMPYMNG